METLGSILIISRLGFVISFVLVLIILQLFEKKGEGRAGQDLGSERLGAKGQGQAKGRAGCRFLLLVYLDPPSAPC